MEKLTITIKAEAGLHARPASLFVKKASEFEAKITLAKDGKEVDAKRLLAVMGLGVKQGEEVIITAEGTDEKAAITALKVLINTELK